MYPGKLTILRAEKVKPISYARQALTEVFWGHVY